MPNGKFKMKYGDSISPGTFRTDAPVQKFAPKGKNIKIDPMDYLQGSSGALGIIGGAGIKLGLRAIPVVKGVVKKSLSNLKSFFKQAKAIKTAKPAAPKVSKPKPTPNLDQWGRPGPTLTNEYGKVLGKGDLMRRGIRPGAHGGYQVKYKTGLDAKGKQMYSWRSTHPLTHR
jgi:hypothetical protein